MRLDEISRRGFLGAVGGAAASAAIPGKDVMSVLNTFAKDLGGTKNVTVLNELLGIVNIMRLDEIAALFRNEYDITDILGDDYVDEFQDAVWDKVDPEIEDYDDRDEEYHQMKQLMLYGKDGKNDTNQVIDILTTLVGETDIKQVRDILAANNIDPAKFFDNKSGVGDTVETAANDAFKKKYGNKYGKGSTPVTPDNLVAAAKEASLPAQSIRLASAIATLMKKIGSKIAPSNDTTAAVPSNNAPPAADKPLALPAPSNNNDFSVSNIDRLKDLSGIKRQ